MSYAIVFSSKTGNTRLLADTLRASLPQNECTYFGAPASEALEAETLYIGLLVGLNKGAYYARRRTRKTHQT